MTANQQACVGASITYGLLSIAAAVADRDVVAIVLGVNAALFVVWTMVQGLLT